VFAGGIGERSARLREEVVNAIECLGFKIDKEGNASVGKSDDDVIEIGHGESKSKVLVCKTDEQVRSFIPLHAVDTPLMSFY
jgi:acetate kinase